MAKIVFGTRTFTRTGVPLLSFPTISADKTQLLFRDGFSTSSSLSPNTIGDIIVTVPVVSAAAVKAKAAELRRDPLNSGLSASQLLEVAAAIIDQSGKRFTASIRTSDTSITDPATRAGTLNEIFISGVLDEGLPSARITEHFSLAGGLLAHPEFLQMISSRVVPSSIFT